MKFGQAIASCYSKYAVFSGRASRSEFWFFVLLQYILLFGCLMFYPMGIGLQLFSLVALGNFLPYVSVLVRRLHDTDHSGWWYWLGLVPLVGVVVLLIWFCTRGTAGSNRFGQDPLTAPG